ncbi:uncharacterized protein LOC100376898 [Saccoglossus kowalevskii]|uniref:Uncharacterized protein LOC100376898 n=1 Tax=Saccoglossus kowalevskii TaxID=10224 RepID=A0ABM0GYQ7_SACKO|nr:PREDICTED: uncharacterized protein LOC100376898 [Saccoglossus kowalevskii]
MSRLSILALMCLFALTTDALANGLFSEDAEDFPFGGALKDKPVLKAFVIKQLVGNPASLPLPLLRALATGNTSPSIVRALIARRVMESNDGENLLPKLLVVRKIASELGKQIIDELKTRKQSERVYTFAMAPTCDCALDYIGDDGALKGFTIDLIEAVCREAGQNCEVQYDPDSKCFAHDDHHFLLGEGLISKQYDACMNWFKTKDRTHVAAFAEPYWKVENINHLYVPNGNPGDFDPTNIAGKKIGFVDGWTGGQSCLENIAGADTMTPVYLVDRRQLFNTLGEGELDAVFIMDGYAKYYLENGYQKISEGIKCAEASFNHAIARKDNDVTEWFSETLKEMKANGKYYALCHKAKQDHGSKGPINCMVEGEEVNAFAKIKCGEGCWV